MMKLVSMCLLLGLLPAAGCGSGGGDGDNTPPPGDCAPAQREAGLDAALAAVETDVDFTFAVARADGRRYVFSRGSSTMATSYESASTSKLVSAVVICRLVEQGHLALSDSPQDHIPGWPISEGDPLRAMTLAHLLSFTSGLTNEPFCQNLPGADFESCVLGIASANAGNGEIPGAQYFYASTHLQVAGLMAVRARGVATWGDVFAEFREQTGLFPTAAFDLPSAGNPRLAGGMHWNAAEYLEFLEALAGGSLLSAGLMEEFLQDRTGGGVVIAYSPVTEIGETWHYGFGFWHECEGPVFDCAAGARISSPGAYGAYPFWDRERGCVGLVARQGALGSGFEGVALERAVRPLVEAWLACP